MNSSAMVLEHLCWGLQASQSPQNSWLHRGWGKGTCSEGTISKSLESTLVLMTLVSTCLSRCKCNPQMCTGLSPVGILNLLVCLCKTKNLWRFLASRSKHSKQAEEACQRWILGTLNKLLKTLEKELLLTGLSTIQSTLSCKAPFGKMIWQWRLAFTHTLSMVVFGKTTQLMRVLCTWETTWDLNTKKNSILTRHRPMKWLSTMLTNMLTPFTPKDLKVLSWMPTGMKIRLGWWTQRSYTLSLFRSLNTQRNYGSLKCMRNLLRRSKT